MRGATIYRLLLPEGLPISIHAPRAGRDGVIWDSWDSSNEFQSTRPVRGATVNRAADQIAGLFQSTRPVRGATLDDLQPYKTVKISIHAPRAGRDLPFSL